MYLFYQLLHVFWFFFIKILLYYLLLNSHHTVMQSKNFLLLHVLDTISNNWLLKLYIVNYSLIPVFYNGKSILHTSTSWLCLIVKISLPSSAVLVNWFQTWSRIGLVWAWFTCIYFTSSVKLIWSLLIFDCSVLTMQPLKNSNFNLNGIYFVR